MHQVKSSVKDSFQIKMSHSRKTASHCYLVVVFILSCPLVQLVPSNHQASDLSTNYHYATSTNQQQQQHLHHHHQRAAFVSCPHQRDNVDCSNRGLVRVPNEGFPRDTRRIRLERNNITEIGPNAFQGMKKLQRIDLSNNNIIKIDQNAFAGLHQLNTLILFSNKLTQLPAQLFQDLHSLQLLMLNANQLSCIPNGLFKHLNNLNLLSLYDNNIESMSNGTFEAFTNIKTIHLGKNPFICDCNLRWLADYLQTNPVETSEATCEGPSRVYGEKLQQINRNRLKCQGSEEVRTKFADQCTQNAQCPLGCVCEGSIVDCSRLSLTDIPDDIPIFATELRLSDNRIRKLRNTGLFKRLPYLQRVDFRANEIVDIEDGTFEGASKLSDLSLSHNQLRHLRAPMFKGLSQLDALILKSNQLTCVLNDTFKYTPKLSYLSLYDNRIRCMMEGTFEQLAHLRTLQLMANPLNCNCHLRWLPEWLSQRASLVGLDLGNPKCAQPKQLHDVSLMEIELRDFQCDQTDQPWQTNTEDNKINALSNKQQQQTAIGQELMSADMADLNGNNQEEQRRTLSAVDVNFGAITTTTSPRNTLQYFEYFCSTGANCPHKCTCHLAEQLVRCSSQKLRDFPKDLDEDTAELFVNDNDIKTIPAASIRHLSELTLLDMSNNRLHYIPEHQFINLTKLQTLILSYNKLQCIQEESFAGLKSLRVLSLHGNDLSTLPATSYRQLPSLTHLALGSNPLYCDCQLRWLAEWIQRDYVEAGIAKCSEPSHMRDRLLLTAPLSQFECHHLISYNESSNLINTLTRHSSGGSGTTSLVNKCDACYEKPCQNGASCKSLPNMDYQCQCDANNYGRDCEFIIDACFDRPCQNGATCKSLLFENTTTNKQNRTEQAAAAAAAALFSCECAPGFTGARCEVNIDDCQGEPCKNGAQCLDMTNGYKCKCLTGFTGANCELSLNPCLSSVDWHHQHHQQHKMSHRYDLDITATDKNSTSTSSTPCYNNGRCVPTGNLSHEYTCECLPGFEGTNCQINIDDCQDHQCQNKAQCIDGVNSYKCQCLDSQTTGEYCEVLIAPVALAMVGTKSDSPMLPVAASSALLQQQQTSSANITNNIVQSLDNSTSASKLRPNDTPMTAINLDKQTDTQRLLSQSTQPSAADSQQGVKKADQFVANESSHGGGGGGITQQQQYTQQYTDISNHLSEVAPSLRQLPSARSPHASSTIEKVSVPIKTLTDVATEVKPTLDQSDQVAPPSSSPQTDSYKHQHQQTTRACPAEMRQQVEHGSCYLQNDNTPMYRCSAGYTGQRCEQAQSFMFKATNESILKFDQYLDNSNSDNYQANISFKFATDEQFGPLFYTGNDYQHITVELYLGHVRVSFNMNKQPATHTYSLKRCNDSNYHQVNIVVNNQYVNFTLDNNTTNDSEHYSMSSPLGSQSSLADLSRSFDLISSRTPSSSLSSTTIREEEIEFEFGDHYYIGGIERATYEEAWRMAHVQSSEWKFRGCMKEIVINGQSLSPALTVAPNTVKPGMGTCQQFEQVDPCKQPAINRCQQANSCLALDRYLVKCQCRQGWSGEFCQEAPTCQRQRVRRYYEDGQGCRSTRQIKLSECVGSCGSECCRATKLKKKRIKMRCQDGTYYVKTIDVIRKCSCHASTATCNAAGTTLSHQQQHDLSQLNTASKSTISRNTSNTHDMMRMMHYSNHHRHNDDDRYDQDEQ